MAAQEDGGRSVLEQLAVPLVLAPLAGGPSTVALAGAVSGAGGLGFLASGYRTAAAMEEEVARLRDTGVDLFGVNVFVPPRVATPPERYAAYVDALRAEVGEQALGAPRPDDDDWARKVEVLCSLRVPVVSFVFGCPAPEVLAALCEAGTEVWVSVTSPGEARAAVEAGAGGLVVQGAEAGGHRASFADEDEQEPLGLLALLQLIGAQEGLPLIAAGGIGDGRGLAAVLAAGARAAQVGSAFLLADEAGTSPVHRGALAGGAATALTRAFTGKPARGIVNRFMTDHRDAPAAYPEVHHVTAPLRAAGRAAMDREVVNLWAGQAHGLARPEPAAAIVERFGREARQALREAAERLGT